MRDLGEQRRIGVLEIIATARGKRAQRLAVIRVARGHDLAAFRRGSRQFDRTFYCFGSAVSKKGNLQVARRQFRQSLGDAPQHNVEHRFARERHQVELRFDGLHDFGMTVSQRKHAISAGKIQIRLAVVIPDRAALRANFYRAPGNFHDARQGRVDVLLVVLVRLVVQRLCGGYVANHAAAAPSSDAIVSSTTATTSRARSRCTIRSRSIAACGMPFKYRLRCLRICGTARASPSSSTMAA